MHANEPSWHKFANGSRNQRPVTRRGIEDYGIMCERLINFLADSQQSAERAQELSGDANARAFVLKVGMREPSSQRASPMCTRRDACAPFQPWKGLRNVI